MLYSMERTKNKRFKTTLTTFKGIESETSSGHFLGAFQPGGVSFYEGKCIMTNLDRCWTNCLKMWKWVSETYDGTQAVSTLKWEWLKSHGFRKNIEANCFFCHWHNEHGGGMLEFGEITICTNCPGVYVSKSFCCQSYLTYKYDEQPKAFYRKLLALDKKRCNHAKSL